MTQSCHFAVAVTDTFVQQRLLIPSAIRSDTIGFPGCAKNLTPLILYDNLISANTICTHLFHSIIASDSSRLFVLLKTYAAAIDRDTDDTQACSLFAATSCNIAGHT